jgi:hypothetical protein
MTLSKFEKACPKCGQAMTASASVCPHCDYIAPAFKYKLVVGCLMLAVFIGLLVVTVLRHAYNVAI